MNNYKIKTPHAAVIIWNYADRIGTPDGGFNASGVSGDISQLDTPAMIISTLSCISITTSKSKAQPDGAFNLVLAPSKNWVSAITAGSWCCIMMSNEPITEESIKKADRNKVKMLGRIESVRCETSVNEEGARQTLYYVSGVDWGTILNSLIYIDNLIASAGEPLNQGNIAAIRIRQALIGDKGSPRNSFVETNLSTLLGILGTKLGIDGTPIGRLAMTEYEFKLPQKVIDFFDFRDIDNNPIKAQTLNNFLVLKTGSLIDVHKYEDQREAVGFINSFTLQGSHSLWQILLENSNPALNEMLCDMDWNNEDNGLKLTLYNRIRPFSYKDFDPERASRGARFKNSGAQSTEGANDSTGELKSFFQYVKCHTIESVDVLSISVGTNWRDKFNFIEIKPDFSDFEVVANMQKQKSQAFDAQSFNREGFKPLIFNTKQFPSSKKNQGGLSPTGGIDWGEMQKWTILLREWYFGSHRLLNGTIVMQGSTEYIAVGNNIKFEAKLLGPTPNLSQKMVESGDNSSVYIMGHVENIGHSFSVNADGARTYKTTIQFVRGIQVNEDGSVFSEGMLDRDVTLIEQKQDQNRLNIFSTSDTQDIGEKVEGT